DSTSKRQRLREFVDLSRPLDKEEHLGQVECGVRQPASPLRAPRDYVPRHAGRVPDQRFPLPRPGGGAAVSSAIAGPAGYLTFVRTAFAEPVHPGRPLFNSPDRIRLAGEREAVQLAHALTLDALNSRVTGQSRYVSRPLRCLASDMCPVYT